MKDDDKFPIAPSSQVIDNSIPGSSVDLDQGHNGGEIGAAIAEIDARVDHLHKTGHSSAADSGVSLSEYLHDIIEEDVETFRDRFSIAPSSQAPQVTSNDGDASARGSLGYF